MTTTSRVLIVCTVHRENGNATAAELHWLLGRLRPNVIFLEHSATEVAAFPAALRDSLELAAVTRYREHNAVEVVPVGLHIADAAEFKLSVDALFDKIEEASPQYCQLEREQRVNTEKGGLAFLNSSDSALLQCAMQRKLGVTVEALADPVLADVYERWTRMNHLRELALLSGVEAFAGSHSFEKAVLLVGAAHRQPLAEKSRQRGNECELEFHWPILEEEDRLAR